MREKRESEEKRSRPHHEPQRWCNGRPGKNCEIQSLPGPEVPAQKKLWQAWITRRERGQKTRKRKKKRKRKRKEKEGRKEKRKKNEKEERKEKGRRMKRRRKERKKERMKEVP